AVYASVVAHVEPSGVEADKRLDDGLERVDAEIWRAGRVRRPPVKHDLDAAVRQRAATDHVGLRRVQHVGQIDILENTGLSEQNLSAAALLGWCSDDEQRARK